MPSADRVELTDLDVITRYSLAVRTASADRDELITALRSDLQWLQDGRRPAAASRPASAPRKTVTKTTTTKAPSAKKTAKKAAKKATGASRRGR